MIQYFCFPDRSIKGGASWISRKGGILEKGGGVDLEKGGGMTPLTNYDLGCYFIFVSVQTATKKIGSLGSFFEVSFFWGSSLFL